MYFLRGPGGGLQQRGGSRRCEQVLREQDVNGLRVCSARWITRSLCLLGVRINTISFCFRLRHTSEMNQILDLTAWAEPEPSSHKLRENDEEMKAAYETALDGAAAGVHGDRCS